MVKLKGQKSELPQKKRRRKIRRFIYDFFSYDSEIIEKPKTVGYTVR